METTTIKVHHKADEAFLTIDDVNSMFEYYREITGKTGEQVNFEYEDYAIPYNISKVTVDGSEVLHLVGHDPDLNKHLLVSVSHDDSNPEDQCSLVTIHFPRDGTNGDKGKANEFAKFFAKKWKGELILFNGRLMPFA